MYRIEIAPKAKKQLKRLKLLHRDAVAIAIEDLKENPSIGKRLERDFTGKYSYRIGVYRIVYRVKEKEKLVEIISAGHRSVAYN